MLSKLDEAKIFERYLGLPVILNKKYRNPLRPDTNAGCFYKQNSRLLFCDYAFPEYSGDCFRIVQILYDCDFYTALQIINIDFNLQLEDKYKDFIKDHSSFCNKPSFLPNQRIGIFKQSTIKVEVMPFLKSDLEYWKEFGIKEETLKLFNVHSCFRSWINDVIYHTYSHKDPQYCYVFPDKIFKIYRPLANKLTKWRTNSGSHVIQGYEQLPLYGEDLIVTSSLKDVMTLYEIGYVAVAPQNEGIIIPENIVDQFRHRFANIHILYDNDEAGIKSATNLSECCGFNMITLPEGPKDPSDFVKSNNLDKLREFLKEKI